MHYIFMYHDRAVEALYSLNFNRHLYLVFFFPNTFHLDFYKYLENATFIQTFV